MPAHCQQGERREARVEKSGLQTTVAAKFNGKRFNSPNDLAIRKNGGAPHSSDWRCLPYNCQN
jgi:hypothetical protein